MFKICELWDKYNYSREIMYCQQIMHHINYLHYMPLVILVLDTRKDSVHHLPALLQNCKFVDSEKTDT